MIADEKEEAPNTDVRSGRLSRNIFIFIAFFFNAMHFIFALSFNARRAFLKKNEMMNVLE